MPAPVAAYRGKVLRNPGIGTQGFTAWWTLNEAAGNSRADSCGSNTLTEQGGNVLSASALISNGASIQGVTTPHNWLRANNDASITGGQYNFTVGCWVKVPTIPLGGYALAVDHWQPGNADWTIICENAGANIWRAGFFVANVIGSGGTAVYSGAFACDNNWHFMMGWLDYSNNLIYVSRDNVTATGVALVRTSFTPTPYLAIGTRAGSPANPNWDVDFIVDEAFFAKRLFTAAERTWLYNSGAGRTWADIA